MKRFLLLELIAARVIRKRKIETEVRSFAFSVDEAIRKALDCQQGEAKLSYRGFVTVVIGIIIIVLLLVLFGRVGVFMLNFVLRVIAFHKAYVAMLYMKYSRCGDCAFPTSFVTECTDVSYVAEEGVELTVHEESVVVEEIKKMELRSRRAQFIYDRNYNRNAVMA